MSTRGRRFQPRPYCFCRRRSPGRDLLVSVPLGSFEFRLGVFVCDVFVVERGRCMFCHRRSCLKLLDPGQFGITNAPDQIGLLGTEFPPRYQAIPDLVGVVRGGRSMASIPTNLR
jgi:hypothetical protein